MPPVLSTPMDARRLPEAGLVLATALKVPMLARGVLAKSRVVLLTARNVPMTAHDMLTTARTLPMTARNVPMTARMVPMSAWLVPAAARVSCVPPTAMSMMGIGNSEPGPPSLRSAS